jgi:PAS domain S-box-containing protein
MDAKKNYGRMRHIVEELEQKKIERERIVEALRESQALYEGARIGYQSLDENGNLIEVNPAWLNILGYSREEVIGKSFSEFIRPEHKDHFNEHFPRFKAVSEILGDEFEMVNKDGSFARRERYRCYLCYGFGTLRFQLRQPFSPIRFRLYT